MQVQCPSCSKVIEAADDRAGQVVSCPACGGQMQLPTLAPATSQVPAPAPQTAYGTAAAPAPQSAEAQAPSKACPYCGESILVVATKCRHCNSVLSGPNAGPGGPRRTSQGITDGTKAVIFGALSFVVCGLLGPFAIYFATKARREPSDRSLGNVGLALGIIGVIVGIGQVLVIAASILSGS